MRLDSIRLENFRNYQDQRVNFDPVCNVICGENAQGKTNLLEAMVCLSTGRSHRTRMDRELVRFGADGFLLEAAVHARDRDFLSRLEAGLGRKKRISVNRVPAKSASELSADPRELEAAEERIDTLYSLLSRHKADTVDQLIERREELRSRLAALDDSDITIADLEREARRALALARESAAEITAARREAAEAFAATLREKAMPLGMKNLQVEVRVEPADISATGMDRVEFMFAFNKNQPLMPVGGAASGGEISRLMLCIKAIIADRMSLPSIIFDEIDTGVSGEVASRIGEMMAQISRSLQVIAITHLPQVAARGGHHFKVFKEDDETSTHTRIAELDPAARVDELALMLGGESSAEAARANAVALLSRK